MRQAVHDVDIQIFDADRPKLVDHGLGDFEGLNAIHGALNDGIDVLDADARPVHSGLCHGDDHFVAKATRVDLDRKLGIAGDRKALADLLGDRL